MHGPQPSIRAFGFIALAALLCVPAANASNKDKEKWLPGFEAEIVRVVEVHGDVRYNEGDPSNQNADLKKSWSVAETGMPIREFYSLATGKDGRAQIEFQSGSVLYVGENSLLLFHSLLSHNGTPYSAVQLVTGEATITGRFEPNEQFEIDTSTYALHMGAGFSPFVRIDSFLDGVAITPQAKDAIFEAATDGLTKPMFYGQSSVSRVVDGQQTPFNIISSTPDDFDFWVQAQKASRDARMAKALAASGMDAPIPGLLELYQSGTFTPCAPYGTCWTAAGDPAPLAPGETLEPRGIPTMADAPFIDVTGASYAAGSGGIAQRAPAAPHNSQLSADSRNVVSVAGLLAEASGTSQYPGYPKKLSVRTAQNGCNLAFNGTRDVVVFSPEEEQRVLQEQTNLIPQRAWSNPGCRYGGWVYSAHAQQYVKVFPKHHHPPHPPREWMSVNSRNAFVPRHPGDKTGVTPGNLRHGLFFVEPKNGHLEMTRANFDPHQRVRDLAQEPRAIRDAAEVQLRAASPAPGKAAPPEIHGAVLAPASHDNAKQLSAEHQLFGAPPTSRQPVSFAKFDYHHEQFLGAPHVDSQGTPGARDSGRGNVYASLSGGFAGTGDARRSDGSAAWHGPSGGSISGGGGSRGGSGGGGGGHSGGGGGGSGGGGHSGGGGGGGGGVGGVGGGGGGGGGGTHR
jgi:hypothetical protein